MWEFLHRLFLWRTVMQNFDLASGIIGSAVGSILTVVISILILKARSSADIFKEMQDDKDA